MIRKVLIVVVFACVASVLAKPSAENLECARQDSRFVEFEKYFDVTNMRTRPVYNLGSENPCCVIAEDYSVYATPKVDKFFENLSFRFDWRFQGKRIGCLIETNTQSFKESPIDEVKLYEEIKKSIYKNPSFAKWLLQESLRYKGESEKSYVAKISCDKRINDGSWGSSVDDVWKNISLSGKYVGTLQMGFESEFRGRLIQCGHRWGYSFSSQYDFMLSDNGDILVSKLFFVSDEHFLASVLNGGYSHIERCKEPKKVGIPFDCYYSINSNEKCQDPFSKTDVPYRFPQFCDYLIIRHDGTIEYGPKSGEW
jgi:hypothetical protein